MQNPSKTLHFNRSLIDFYSQYCIILIGEEVSPLACKLEATGTYPQFLLIRLWIKKKQVFFKDCNSLIFSNIINWLTPLNWYLVMKWKRKTKTKRTERNVN